MNPNRLLLIATALAVLSACAAPRKPPPPVAAPPPRPAPLAPPPPPPPADWRDAPISTGTWSYTANTAAFGTVGAAPLFTLRCDPAGGQIMLSRAGTATGLVPLTLTTTSIRRSFTVANITTSPAIPPSALAVAIPARDPILDAMVFSRGRFMIEVPGLPTLYLPAWPEVARVVEDCR